jgi:hypothetical protein
MRTQNYIEPEDERTAFPGCSNAETHELISDADLSAVTPEELAAFDDSTFDTRGISIPEEMRDQDYLFELLDDAQRVEGMPDASADKVAEHLLFDRCEYLRAPAWDLVSAERFTQLIPLVIHAYGDVRREWSADYTVLDPEINVAFLQRCWQLGAAASPEELNWTLINARKCGKLHGMTRSKRYSIHRDQMDKVGFACELALRHMQDRAFLQEQKVLSLDKLLCSPRLAEEFDQLAGRLAPGFDPIKYRWAALSLRKARRPATVNFDEGSSRITLHDLGSINAIKPSRLSACPGLLWLQVADQSTFVGVANNIRLQFDSILESAGPSVVPEWMEHPSRSVARLYISEMAGSREDERERYRSAVMKKHGSRLNFFIPSMFPSAA